MKSSRKERLMTILLVVGILLLGAVTAWAQITWTVDDDGPANFTAIQAAISAASVGDTIIVAPGTYVEYTGTPGAGCAIDVPWFANGAGGLTILSSGGAANTIIDCGGAAWGVQMVSNQVTFEGFTVKNAYSVINQVSGKGHALSDLILTDFVNYGIGVYAGDHCIFSGITIHTNDVSKSENRIVKGIDIQEYGSGGNSNNTFEDITIYDIETTGAYGTSMGIYFEGDNPDTHPTTGNTFTNVEIYDLASAYFNCGVYILDGSFDGTGHIGPYAIEDTTFSGGSIYGLTENGVDVVSRGFYVKGGNENLDITGFEITGADEGVYFKGFDWVQPPIFAPTGWDNQDSWAESGGGTWVDPRTGSYAAGIEISDYSPPTLDDYLIMPQQLISSGDTVAFYAHGTHMSGNVHFQLKVSTTGTDPADFTDTLGTYLAPTSFASWLAISEDLSAYDGQNIYIAIYAYESVSGPPGGELLIDDVTLPDASSQGFEGVLTTVGAVDVAIHENNIYGNSNYGVDNTNGVGTIDAEYNWWGDTDPTDDVSGNVEYSVWWGENYVGDDHSSPWLWFTNDSIQDAIDVASADDFVYVVPGTYYENVDLDTLGVYLWTNPGAVIDGGMSGNAVKVTADGTTIDNFEILNGRPNGIFVQGSNDTGIGGNEIHDNKNSNIKLVNSDWTWIGDNILYNSKYGILVQGSDYTGIGGNEIHDNKNSNIKLVNSDWTWIGDNILYNSKYGIYLKKSDENRMADNEIHNNTWAGIYLYLSNWNGIFDNEINQNETGVSLNESNDNSIGGNEIKKNTGAGIYLYLSGLNGIFGNEIYKNATGVSLNESNDNSIGGNEIYKNATGVSLNESNDNSIGGNEIKKNTGDGIYLYLSGLNGIFGNEIYKNATGVSLNESNDNSIGGNEIYKNATGVSLNESNDNSIGGNEIKKNTGDGIYLYLSDWNGIFGNEIYKNATGVSLNESSDNRIEANEIHNNTWDGIYLHIGDGTSIVDNDIYGNTTGIHINDSYTHAILGNNIQDNDYGIHQEGYSIENTVHGNAIVGNAIAGVWNDDVGLAYIIDAALNWWGDVNGPAHADNPAGSGDVVSDNVIFSPWLGIGTDAEPGTVGWQPVSPMLIIVDDVGPVPPAETVLGQVVNTVAGYLNRAIGAANLYVGTDTIVVRHGTYDGSEPITEAVNIVSETGSAAHTTLSGDMTLGSSYIVLGRRGQGFTLLGTITAPVGTDASTIQANWNNLLGALVNGGTGMLDATLNYWGDANGPSAGDVTGTVAYSPWLGLVADDSPMLFVVAPVGSEPAGGYLNTAIAAANDLPGTDTIEVRHGTYDGSEPITEAVNIVSETGSASHTTLNGNMSISGNGVLIGLPLQGFRMNGNVMVGAGANAGTSSINWCDVYGNMTNNGTGTFDAQYNYWGTLLESVVDSRTTGAIDYEPFLPKNADDSYVDATAIINAGLASGMDPAIDQLWLMVQLGQDVSTFIGYAGVAGAGAFAGAPAGGEINLGGAAGGGGAVEGAISGTYTPGDPIDGRFTLTDPVTGEPITDAAVTTSLLGPDGALVFWGCATYDETTGEYVFTIDTSGLAPGTYELIIQTDDGQSKTVSIEVLAA